MPELGYRPVNKYLPPRRARMAPPAVTDGAAAADRRSRRHRPAALGRPAAVAVMIHARCPHSCAPATLRPWGRRGPGEVGGATCIQPSRSSSSPPPPAPGSRCCSCSGSACRSGCCRPTRGSASPRSPSPLLLAAGGLVSSVFHLGRPERAWRAFSQWRSSWLSREGVLSVATFVPAAIFAIGWMFFGATSGFIGLCGIARRGARGRHDLLHRHDLRVAEADPPMAQPLGRAELLRARADGAGCCCSISSSGSGCRGRSASPILTLLVIAAAWCAQGSLLALDRHDFGAEHRRQRHRARQTRPGAACSNRRTPRTITCCRRWASASPASTGSGCARSLGSPASRCRRC